MSTMDDKNEQDKAEVTEPNREQSTQSNFFDEDDIAEIAAEADDVLNALRRRGIGDRRHPRRSN